MYNKGYVIGLLVYSSKSDASRINFHLMSSLEGYEFIFYFFCL